MRKRIWIALLLAVSISIMACTGKTATEKPTTTESGATEAAEQTEATQGGVEYRDEINIAITAQPPTLDPPTTASQLTLDVSQNFYETLYTMNENYEPAPMLAESYEANEDNTKYTFKLRQGILFHDGTEMKAEDVAASMNYWIEKSTRAKNILGEAVFTVVDDYTVECTLPNPSTDLLTLMSAQTTYPAIRTKAAIEGAGETGVTDYNGTGPYKFVEWAQDQYILLEKNDNYQALDTPASGFSGKKEALVNKIYYRIVPDASTRVSGLLTGIYDLTEGIPTENYQEFVDNPEFELYSEAGGTLTLFFNVKEGILSDAKVRQAIVTGINSEEVMLASYKDPGLFTLDPGYMNKNNPKWASTAGQENYNLADPEKAKEQLKAAGYNGETVRLLTTQDYNEMYNATLVIQEQLRQMGVNAQVDTFDFPTFMEKRADRSTWDIFITSNGYQVLPQQLLVVDPTWAGADDPKIAEFITTIRQAKTDEEAKAGWDALQGFLYNDYISSLALGQYNTIMVANKKVEGVVYWQAPILWNVRVQK